MTVNDSVKQMGDVATKNLERANAMVELNMRTWERLVGRQMEAVNLCLEQGLRMMKVATESKGYNDYLKGQTEIVKDVTEQMMAEAKVNMKLAGDLREDYRAWYERSLSDLSSDMRRSVSTSAV
ncbi:phasin family protein [Thioalkalicoccus limnaeus]|uniref:Phasin family protein n=1 Tax=Thioalkalicoccus limnaeus TaxID=120681 RepID=A0ABV4BH36_9GAMM